MALNNLKAHQIVLDDGVKVFTFDIKGDATHEIEARNTEANQTNMGQPIMGSAKNASETLKVTIPSVVEYRAPLLDFSKTQNPITATLYDNEKKTLVMFRDCIMSSNLSLIYSLENDKTIDIELKGVSK